MIRDLEIKNYRLFQQFKISSLARVTLIVGDNNAGKSTLLEAIHLLTSDDARLSLISILGERGEVASGFLDPKLNQGQASGYQISQIFNDHLIKLGQSASITTSSNNKKMLRLALRESTKSRASKQASLFDNDNTTIIGSYADLLIFERDNIGLSNSRDRIGITEDGILLNIRFKHASYLKDKSRFITPNYLGYDELATLWDNITLTPKEDKVVEALQILEPLVERISFMSSQTSNSGILLRLKGQSEPIPLGSMGDGMRRIMAIAAALVSVEQGTLLVDEIDTGLYHDALIDMWKLVLETSEKQNAQLFATTHSWDCVKAFQQALTALKKPDIGKLIRLEKSNGQVKAIPYSTNELNIAVEQGIEVR